MQFDNEKRITTTREFLRPTDEPDTINLPFTLKDYKAVCKELSDKDLNHILHPRALSPLEE